MVVSLLDEVRKVDLGDKRLNKRLGKIIEELGDNPNLSIPGATHSRAEMEAAYRFFDNAKVSPQKILQPHFDATLERISQCDFVLLVQDTTELDLTRPHQEVQGAGPMDSGGRRGAFFHPLMAFALDGLPLGTAWQKNWARQEVQTNLSPEEKEQKRIRTPWRLQTATDSRQRTISSHSVASSWVRSACAVYSLRRGWIWSSYFHGPHGN